MPASELQLKLLRENKRCIELAGTMTQVVYPKLIYLLEQLGQEQVCFSSIKTYKNFYFDLNKGFVFYIVDKPEDDYNVSVSGHKICPLFRDSNHACLDKKDSTIKRYIDFCSEVIKQVRILEQELDKVNQTLIDAQNIKLPLERKTIFEKTIK